MQNTPGYELWRSRRHEVVIINHGGFRRQSVWKGRKCSSRHRVKMAGFVCDVPYSGLLLHAPAANKCRGFPFLFRRCDITAGSYTCLIYPQSLRLSRSPAAVTFQASTDLRRAAELLGQLYWPPNEQMSCLEERVGLFRIADSLVYWEICRRAHLLA